MKESYVIKGMSCVSCAAKIEKIVKKMDGISDGVVNFANETLTITTNGSVDQNHMEKTIINLGYEIEKKSSFKTITLKLMGMTCSSCATTIEKSL